MCHVRDQVQALRSFATWISRSGLRVVIYGDSLTAGAPSRTPFGQEFCRSLRSVGCHVEAEICGLCALTARQMFLAADEESVSDLWRRSGKGLLRLLKNADLVLLMAGTNDLASSMASEIIESLRGLHSACHRRGVPTVALGIPDSGGRQLKRFPFLGATRREVNASLAAWVKADEKKPEAFVNTMALLPYGPKSREAGCWESDGVHFTSEGSRVLGWRLAQVLQPLMLRQAACILSKCVFEVTS